MFEPLRVEERTRNDQVGACFSGTDELAGGIGDRDDLLALESHFATSTVPPGGFEVSKRLVSTTVVDECDLGSGTVGRDDYGGGYRTGHDYEDRNQPPQAPPGSASEKPGLVGGQFGLLFADHSAAPGCVDETVLEGCQREVALVAPALQLFELGAARQIVRILLGLAPGLDCRSQKGATTQVGPAVLDPASEPGPGGEERLVSDLNRRGPVGSSIERKQAKGPELLECGPDVDRVEG